MINEKKKLSVLSVVYMTKRREKSVYRQITNIPIYTGTHNSAEVAEANVDI